MRNPETLLCTAMKETFYQAIGRSIAEALQDALNQDSISRLFMKQRENKEDTVVAKQEPPIATQDESKATDPSFLNAQSAFIRQAVTTLEASLAEKVKALTRGAFANMFVGRAVEMVLEATDNS